MSGHSRNHHLLSDPSQMGIELPGGQVDPIHSLTEEWERKSLLPSWRTVSFLLVFLLVPSILSAFYLLTRFVDR